MTQMRTIMTCVFLLFLAAGCSIAEDDRCADGYEWVQKYRMCLPIEPDDTGEPEVIDTDPQPNGIGNVCTADSDCTALELDADFCLINPTDPVAGGTCSIFGCVPEDCTGGFSCCDCEPSGSTLVSTEEPFCVPDTYVPLIRGIGCVCE